MAGPQPGTPRGPAPRTAHRGADQPVLWAAAWAGVALVGTGLVLGAAVVLQLTDAPVVVPGALVAGLAVGIVQYARFTTVGIMRRWMVREERRHLETLSRLAEVEGHARLASLAPPYPLPFESWSMAADGAAILAVQIGSARPRLVVELGSGMTSVMIGLMLRRQGEGRVISLEHDDGWGARTRRHVTGMDLADRVTVVDAPLIPYELGGRTYRWYTLPPELEGQAIDVLLVDGPPKRVDPSGMPRYPALPLLDARLAPGAVVVVDDADRANERAMVERWIAEVPGWQVEWIPSVRGIAILTRTAGRPQEGIGPTTAS